MKPFRRNVRNFLHKKINNANLHVFTKGGLKAIVDKVMRIDD